MGLLLFANENCEKRETSKSDYLNRPSVSVSESVPTETAAEEPKKHVAPVVQQAAPVVNTDEDDEEEDEDEEKPRKKKKDKKGPGLFDFFGKIQNLGGTMFKDED